MLIEFAKMAKIHNFLKTNSWLDLAKANHNGISGQITTWGKK